MGHISSHSNHLTFHGNFTHTHMVSKTTLSGDEFLALACWNRRQFPLARNFDGASSAIACKEPRQIWKLIRTSLALYGGSMTIAIPNQGHLIGHWSAHRSCRKTEPLTRTRTRNEEVSVTFEGYSKENCLQNLSQIVGYPSSRMALSHRLLFVQSLPYQSVSLGVPIFKIQGALAWNILNKIA